MSTEARTVLDAIVELTERWCNARRRTLLDHFTTGRMNGYEQAIALLLGCTQQEARNALMVGEL